MTLVPCDDSQTTIQPYNNPDEKSTQSLQSDQYIGPSLLSAQYTKAIFWSQYDNLIETQSR